MLQSWLVRPTAGKQHYLEYYGCALIKRTNWVSLLSERTIAHLGDRQCIEELLAASAGTDVDTAGTGIAIRTGTAPQTGDIPTGDTLPLFHAVAQVLRPVRMEALRGPGNGFPDDRAQAWLEAFDGSV